MSIALVVTAGFGNEVFRGDIQDVVRRGYSPFEVELDAVGFDNYETVQRYVREEPVFEIGEDPVYVPDEETLIDYTIDDREVIRLYLQYQRDILKKFFN